MRKPKHNAPSMSPFMRKQLLGEINMLMQQGQLQLAFEKVEPLTRRKSKDNEAWILRAMIAEKRNNPIETARCAQLAVDIKPSVMGHILLARALRFVGKTNDAVKHCQKALQLDPENNLTKMTLGSTFEEAGRFSEARAVIEPLWNELKGTQVPIKEELAYEMSKLLVHDKEYENAVQIIDEHVDSDGTVESIRVVGLYLKAKACDRNKQYDEAYEAAQKANEIGKLEFNPQIYSNQVDVLCDNWSKDAMVKFPTSRSMSELPVFVAGMPRSGTSLIDQIIDAHPLAAGVGELNSIEKFAFELSQHYDSTKEPPDCFGKFQEREWTKAANLYEQEIKKLAPVGVKRIVNKSLGNNKLVGLLAKLFPKTRIIHAMRDPRDMAVSCFMGGFNNRMHPWTTKLEWCASAWEQSQRMMQHWIEALDVPVLEVRYEELVRDPDKQFPRIIEFLGLEWDEACKKFHESKRTVRTLSYDQVNKPLYTTSAGRHVNYLNHIEKIHWPTY